MRWSEISRYGEGVRSQSTLTIPGGRTLELGRRTLVVGVVNVTPDSFSDGGCYSDVHRAVDRALQIQHSGADIIEIGGESTRPGAEPVSVGEEWDRIRTVLESLDGRINIPISVDTYKSEVARRAVELGAGLINDISALRLDPDIATVAAESGAGLVLMHMRGTPGTMQKLPPSHDIFAEIEADLNIAVQKAERAGVKRGQVILDPGVGFGKTAEQNLSIINNLIRLSNLGFPVMIGTSRKKFLGTITGKGESERVFATAATVAAAILRGAHFVRVHDVEEMIDVVKVSDAIARAD